VPGTNFVRCVFLNPMARGLYDDIEVAGLRPLPVCVRTLARTSTTRANRARRRAVRQERRFPAPLVPPRRQAHPRENDFTGHGVTGRATSTTGGTGVLGDAPNSSNGVGVEADSASGTALRVSGRATFSTAGTAVIASGNKTVTVTLAGVTTTDFVLATVQGLGAFYVKNASAGTGQFTIRINKVPTAPATVTVAYFVISAS
jgi:hypothetical protein